MLYVMSEKTFADELAKPEPLLVKFSAPWCGPCKAMAPVFEAVAADFPYVNAVTVDTDACPAIASRYHVRGLPAFAMFRGGQLQAIKSGAMPAGELREWIKANAG